jgi:hypothetical protein
VLSFQYEKVENLRLGLETRLLPVAEFDSKFMIQNGQNVASLTIAQQCDY